jgi:predicted RND superfamily exporter protein
MNNIYVKLAVVFIILILLYIRRRENKGILLPILFIVITVSVLYYFRNTLQIGQFFTLQ